jgi:hypothetical protein
MNKKLLLSIITVLLVVSRYLPASAAEPLYGFKTSPVGELTALELKFESGRVGMLKTGFVNMGHYFKRFGIGLQLGRYSEVLNNNHHLPQGTGMWEWLPVRISYIPFLMRGKYHGGDWEFMENEPFFVWNSVTPYEYARIYIRIFMETSFRQVMHYPRFYPFVLTNGIQFNYGLLSIEGGYRIQPHRWKRLTNRYLNSDPNGFTLNGLFISANVTIGGILTRTEIKKAIQ